MGLRAATLLRSAVCEWFLIFLLLFESALSYFLARFARYCQLQFPCLLCTRLDCFFGKDKQEFYQNLFCNNHKSEIASLVSCHAHGKFVDGNRMCDDCLLSFTTSTKPNTKSHKLLVGKLGMVNGGSGSQSLSLSRDFLAGTKGSNTCACCHKLWKSEQNELRSVQPKSPRRSVLKPPYIPLPPVPRQSRLNHRENSKKTKGKSSGSEGKCSYRQPSHVWNNQPKVVYSDSESDFPFSDDDDVASVFHGRATQFKPVVPPRHVLRGLNLTNPNTSSPKAMQSHPGSFEEPKIDKHHDVPEEINLKTANQSGSELPELVPLDEVSSSPNVKSIPCGKCDDVKTTSSPFQNSLPTSISEQMTLDGTRSLVATSLDKSEDVTKSSGAELATKEDMKDTQKIGITQKASVETDQVVSASASASPTQEKSNNMIQSPVSTKESVAAGRSDNSEVLVNNVQSTERHNEASDSNEAKALSSSSSVDSDFEYQDGSKLNEIEGESIVDQLKRQLEHDKKCLAALQKELEEERNASAIATNETMNMITRLQEEKAALQMEALQYLRMMDEQAEYDRDELDKVNDLMTEKEKELQDLEAELEFYRENWPEEPTVIGMHDEGSNLKVENAAVPKTATDITNAVTISDSKLTKVPKVHGEGPAGATSSPLDFEEEKLYILKRLKSLQNRLKELYGNGVNMSNGNCTDKDVSASSGSDVCSPSNGDNHSRSEAQKPRKEVELETLENEITDLSERLESIEFNHNLLEHIFNSLRSGDDGKQFIQDLAIQLRDIRKIGIRSRW